MNLLLLMFNNPFIILVLMAVFLIVLLVSFESLKKMSVFGQRTAFIIAICVSLLSILGLLRFMDTPKAAPQTAHNEPGFYINLDFILLPYVALALAIILTLLLRWFAGRYREHQTTSFEKDTRSRLK